MVAIEMTYQGELHCEALHLPSGTRMSTDAPKDNQGKGESFSPTDLVATALGTCILTVMGIAARSMQVSIEGTKVRVEKEMIAKPTRRIAKLTSVVSFMHAMSPEQQEKLEAVALACPVKQSLHPDIEAPIHFIWPK